MEKQLTFRNIFLNMDRDRELLVNFLMRHQLKYEEDIDYAVGLFAGNKLYACGCCSGSLLKCFAVEEELRGQNVLGSIVTALVAKCFSSGFFEPIVITPSYNRSIFVNCGFFPVAETDKLVFMEQKHDGIESFTDAMFHSGDAQKAAGAIVMNCNPFTRGHRYLVEYAAARCEVLYIFVVQEDRSIFPFDIRLELVKQGVADLSNVRVNSGGNYIISSATFPTYFLKKEDKAVKVQARMDATIFANRIAPLLSIKKRFVGSEPRCLVTSQYNCIMQQVLPAAGIDVIEIPRIETTDGEVISASRVRQMLAEGVIDESLLCLVPETTYQYLKSPGAISVLTKLQERVS